MEFNVYRVFVVAVFGFLKYFSVNIYRLMNYLPLSCVCKWAVGSSNVIFGALAVNLFSIECIYKEVIKKTQL